jgi:hypothetical protein
MIQQTRIRKKKCHGEKKEKSTGGNKKVKTETQKEIVNTLRLFATLDDCLR